MATATPSILIVVATLKTEADYTATRAFACLKQLGLTVKIFPKNHTGISELYNSVLASDTEHDIVTFIHDDVEIHDLLFVQKITEAHLHFNIVGIAGAISQDYTQRKPPAWHLSSVGPNDGRGIALHAFIDDPSKPNSIDYQSVFYGPTPAAVVVIDGLFISVAMHTIRISGVRFNPHFTFHHYDMAFCVNASRKHLSIGVWPIFCVHFVDDKKHFKKPNSGSDKKEFRKDKPYGDKEGFRKNKNFGEKRDFSDRFGKKEGGREKFSKDSPYREKRDFKDKKFGERKSSSFKRDGERKDFSRENRFEKKEYGNRNFTDKKEFRKDRSFGDKEGLRKSKDFGENREPDSKRKEFFKKDYLEEDPFSVRRSEREDENEFRRPQRGKKENPNFERTTKKFLIKKEKPAPEEIHKEKMNLLSKLNKNSKFNDIHDDDEDIPSELRINRFLAKCGFGSRRDAEKLILDGKVSINGKMTQDLSFKIQIGKDEVSVNGEIVTPIVKNLTIAFNKPVGYICSHFDIHNENTVFQLLPKEYKRFFLAGRLDMTSRGLMILSSDGDLIQTLSHPTFHIKKTYHLIVEDCPPEKLLRETFLRGIEDEGEFLRAKDVEVLDREKGLVKVVLEEGKKRQLHRMFANIGSKVLDLQRIQIGKLKLDDLGINEGEFKTIEKEDIFYD